MIDLLAFHMVGPEWRNARSWKDGLSIGRGIGIDSWTDWGLVILKLTCPIQWQLQIKGQAKGNWMLQNSYYSSSMTSMISYQHLDENKITNRLKLPIE